MRCLLSIDAGGTKCQTVAVSENGELLGWGRSGFHDALDREHVHGGSGRSIESIKDAIVQAVQGVDCTELHIAGGYRDKYLDAVVQTRHTGDIQYHTCHEWDGILEIVGLESGIIASSGTGAFVHLTGNDGSHCHFDSLGPVLGDWGSAYHIGMLAVQAAAKNDWHPRHNTSLKKRVYEALHLEEKGHRGTSLIFIFERTKDRAAIADLARIVNEEAGKGDAVANKILEEAASGLAETVFDVYDGFKLKDSGCSLVGTGGVIEGCDLFWRHFCDRAAAFAPDLPMLKTDLPHVVGTALFAMPAFANGNCQAARKRLIDSAREVFSSNKKEFSE